MNLKNDFCLYFETEGVYQLIYIFYKYYIGLDKFLVS